MTLLMVVYWLKADEGRRTKDGGHRGDRWLVGMGVVLGLGLVTKTTFVPVALAVVACFAC